MCCFILIRGCIKVERIIFIFSVLLTIPLLLCCDNDKKEDLVAGKKVFETYCWGCHHQSAVAFGPSFSEIASKRSVPEIQSMIVDPKNVSKVFGYKRSVMPPFELNSHELDSITNYILSYKLKEK